MSKIIKAGILRTDALRNSEDRRLADVSSESLERSTGTRLQWTLKNLEESFSFSGEEEFWRQAHVNMFQLSIYVTNDPKTEWLSTTSYYVSWFCIWTGLSWMVLPLREVPARAMQVPSSLMAVTSDGVAGTSGGCWATVSFCVTRCGLPHSMVISGGLDVLHDDWLPKSKWKMLIISRLGPLVT